MVSPGDTEAAQNAYACAASQMAEYARAIGKEAGQHLPQRRTLLL
jgi:hypothetical protein